jgi:tRNA-binding EMAP/Myf-like protein
LGDILFQKIEVKDQSVESGIKAIKTKSSEAKKGNPVEPEVEDHTIDFTKVEIRVGLITKVWNHPTAERLFCEEIDLGEITGPRQVFR